MYIGDYICIYICIYIYNIFPTNNSVRIVMIVTIAILIPDGAPVRLLILHLFVGEPSVDDSWPGASFGGGYGSPQQSHSLGLRV